jgi:hypothetical protein
MGMVLYTPGETLREIMNPTLHLTSVNLSLGFADAHRGNGDSVCRYTEHKIEGKI